VRDVLRSLAQAPAAGFTPFLIAWILVATATPASADQPVEAAQTTVLPPVVAVGEPAAEKFVSEFDSTGFVEIIDTSQAWRGYETVGELLDHSVGIQVRHFGGREDFSTVSIRGATPGQVKILLDGVNLSLANNNIVNLADLPMDSVERIEIYRGFTPIRFASSGASSIVNIVTKKGTQAVHGGSATYGSFNTGKISLFATEPVGLGSLAGTVTYRHTDGDFDFDDKGEPLDPTDDRNTRRINNDFDAVDVLLRYFRPFESGAELTLTNSTFYKDEGAPGRGSPQASKARFEAARSIFSGAFDSAGGSHAELNLTLAEQKLKDPTVIRDDGTVDSLGFPYEKQRGRTVAVAGRASAPWAWGRYNLFEASVEPGYERFHEKFPSDLDDLPSRTEERWGLAGAIGHELWMPGIRASLALQLRHEQIWNEFDTDNVFPPIDDDDVPSKNEHSTDPRVGLRWDARDDLVFKGNYSTYFRPPTFGELFGDDGFSASNPSLDPETGTNRDIGSRTSTTRSTTSSFSYRAADGFRVPKISAKRTFAVTKSDWKRIPPQGSLSRLTTPTRIPKIAAIFATRRAKLCRLWQKTNCTCVPESIARSGVSAGNSSTKARCSSTAWKTRAMRYRQRPSRTPHFLCARPDPGSGSKSRWKI
jgi:iron complex outermembrane receptor protein